MSSLTRPPQRVIGIGASAGGIQPLIDVLAGLPADLPHAICVTVHISASAKSALPEILDRHCALSVTVARHRARLSAGCVFVAPPDRHLVVVDGRVELSRGPKENGVRPAVDAMLRSIAAGDGRGVAVVLSGALGDGSNGARLVLQAGGEVIVQDPEDAAVSSMPQRALELVDGGARVLRAKEIGAALAELDPDDSRGEEPDMDVSRPTHAPGSRPEGPATGFTCPECNGAIWEVHEGDVTTYRCRIGHAYSEDAMVSEQGSAVESALWAALEILEERAELLRKMASQRTGKGALRDRFMGAAADADARAELIRTALATGEPGGDAISVETTAAG